MVKVIVETTESVLAAATRIRKSFKREGMPGQNISFLGPPEAGAQYNLP
jgi:hypothetical protein